jgi:hypothetical protein
MVPPSMVAACCITAAVCGNEKFSANTPEGILSKMQVGIAVETVSKKNFCMKDFLKFFGDFSQKKEEILTILTVVFIQAALLVKIKYMTVKKSKAR